MRREVELAVLKRDADDSNVAVATSTLFLLRRLFEMS